MLQIYNLKLSNKQTNYFSKERDWRALKACMVIEPTTCTILNNNYKYYSPQFL